MLPNSLIARHYLPRGAVFWLAFRALAGVAIKFAGGDDVHTNRARSGLLACGGLCVPGTVGPILGNMRLQLIGAFAYGVMLPVICLVLSRIFRRNARA